VSNSSEFCRHNPLCWFSTSVYCCKRVFRYRISPETFGYPRTPRLLRSTKLPLQMVPQNFSPGGGGWSGQGANLVTPLHLVPAPGIAGRLPFSPIYWGHTHRESGALLPRGGVELLCHSLNVSFLSFLCRTGWFSSGDVVQSSRFASRPDLGYVHKRSPFAESFHTNTRTVPWNRKCVSPTHPSPCSLHVNISFNSITTQSFSGYGVI
jgi:hypothetical protein